MRKSSLSFVINEVFSSFMKMWWTTNYGWVKISTDSPGCKIYRMQAGIRGSRISRPRRLSNIYRVIIMSLGMLWREGRWAIRSMREGHWNVLGINHRCRKTIRAALRLKIIEEIIQWISNRIEVNSLIRTNCPRKKNNKDSINTSIRSLLCQ